MWIAAAGPNAINLPRLLDAHYFSLLPHGIYHNQVEMFYQKREQIAFSGL